MRFGVSGRALMSPPRHTTRLRHTTPRHTPRSCGTRHRRGTWRRAVQASLHQRRRRAPQHPRTRYGCMEPLEAGPRHRARIPAAGNVTWSHATRPVPASSAPPACAAPGARRLPATRGPSSTTSSCNASASASSRRSAGGRAPSRVWARRRKAGSAASSPAAWSRSSAAASSTARTSPGCRSSASNRAASSAFQRASARKTVAGPGSKEGGTARASPRRWRSARTRYGAVTGKGTAAGALNAPAWACAPPARRRVGGRSRVRGRPVRAGGSCAGRARWAVR